MFFKNVKIKKHQTDTLILGIRQPDDEMSETDEVQIRNYLVKNYPDHLVKIKLCDCDARSKQNEVYRSFYLRRAAKASAFLKEKKIPGKMIQFE